VLPNLFWRTKVVLRAPQQKNLSTQHDRRFGCIRTIWPTRVLDKSDFSMPEIIFERHLNRVGRNPNSRKSPQLHRDESAFARRDPRCSEKGAMDESQSNFYPAANPNVDNPLRPICAN